MPKMLTQLTPKQVKAARKTLGIKQKELAEIVNVRLNTVGRWECGLAPCTGPAAILIQKLVEEKKAQLAEEAELQDAAVA